MIRKKALSIFFILCFYAVSAQEEKECILKVDLGTESEQLLDLFGMEDIFYYKVSLSGSNLINKYYTITSAEYKNQELCSIDTIINLKDLNLTIDSNTLNFRVMLKQINNDSVKVYLKHPKLTSINYYKTTNGYYRFSDISNGTEQKFSYKEEIPLFIYRLPGTDPDNPTEIKFCMLGNNRVDPKDWCKKFKIEHLFVFYLKLIE